MKKKCYSLIIFLFFISSLINNCFAQLTKPEVENVYGGRINAINGYAYKSDTTRIFIATESANSVFYADVKTPAIAAASFGTFYKVPSLDADNNFGGGIQNLQVHSSSGVIYFPLGNKIYRTTVAASTATEFINGVNVNVFIYANNLFYTNNNNFYFGTLDGSGNFTASAGSPIAFPIGAGFLKFAVDPINNLLYLFYPGSNSTLKLYQSSASYNSFNSSTIFNDISPTTLSVGYEFKAFGIAMDGRLFIAGSPNGPGFKQISFSDNDTLFTNVNTGIDGVGGEVLSFSGTSSNYHVYYTKAASNNRGASGSWITFGQTGFETHPNDGTVYADPLDTNIVYMTTDQGIGASINEGFNIFEIDEGVEAVQVNDFDMSADKKTGWLASKAGIRRVTNYTTSASWSNAMFPNGDGSPYYSVEMILDTNKAYVGNSRVYKTLNSGRNWTRLFSPEDAPYNWTGGIVCEAIEVCKFDTSIVFAGYTLQGTDKGGLFYSNNSGLTWSQIKLDVSAIPAKDVDVYDIVFTKEGADTVAYVGVDYELAAPTGRSIYRVVKSGTTWTATQDMNAINTSTGSLIVASIKDLEVSSTGDTVFASGTDAGINHPIAYYKPITATNKWTPFTTSGFPFVNGKQGHAITLGHDTVYVAVDNEIYYLPTSASSWTLGYTYPVGTQIYVLYFDDLLVGTGTGLYGQIGQKGVGVFNHINEKQGFVLYPNPTSESVRIKLTQNLGVEASVEVIDFLGKIKIKKHNLIDNKIDLKELPNGMYLVKVTQGSNNYSQRLIIKK